MDGTGSPGGTEVGLLEQLLPRSGNAAAASGSRGEAFRC